MGLSVIICPACGNAEGMEGAASRPCPSIIPDTGEGRVEQGLLCSAQKCQLCTWDGTEPPCSILKHHLHGRQSRLAPLHPKTPPLQTGWSRATLQHPRMPFPTSCCNFPSAPFRSRPAHPCPPDPRETESRRAVPAPRKESGWAVPSTRHSMGSRARIILTPQKTPATGGDKDTHMSCTKQLSKLQGSSVPTSLEAEVGRTLLLAIWTAPSSAGLHLAPPTDPHALWHQRGWGHAGLCTRCT